MFIINVFRLNLGHHNSKILSFHTLQLVTCRLEFCFNFVVLVLHSLYVYMH